MLRLACSAVGLPLVILTKSPSARAGTSPWRLRLISPGSSKRKSSPCSIAFLAFATSGAATSTSARRSEFAKDCIALKNFSGFVPLAIGRVRRLTSTASFSALVGATTPVSQGTATSAQSPNSEAVEYGSPSSIPLMWPNPVYLGL